MNKKTGKNHLCPCRSGKKYKITDIGLSGTQNKDKFYIYSRIITYRGTSFNTGLNLLFNKNDSFIKDFINKNKENYNPQTELTRFVELYNRYTRDPDKVRGVQY